MRWRDVDLANHRDLWGPRETRLAAELSVPDSSAKNPNVVRHVS